MATLQKLGDESLYLLNSSHMRIGRATDNEIVLDDESVSAYHALITIRKSPDKEGTKEYIIEDLESTNKTFINSKLVSSYRLHDGDIIRVGLVRLKFSTKEYIPPKNDFSKTTRLSPYKAYKS